MQFRVLRPEELDVWAGHCSSVFVGVEKEYFLRHFRDDPWRDFNGVFVAMDGGTIASTLRVFRRKAWMGGAQVPMGGIGEVSTKADYRGQGLAGTLLKMALDYMQREGLAVSLLFTGAARDFYRRFGWDCLPKPYKRYRAAAGAQADGRALGAGDLPAMRAVNDAAAQTNWSVVREGDEYWDMWMRSSLLKPMRYGAFESGRLAAWITADRTDNGFDITEFKALPGREGLFDGLCALLAAQEGLGAVPFTSPAWYPSRNECETAYDETGAMVRLIRPINLGGQAVEDTAGLILCSRACQDSNLDHF